MRLGLVLPDGPDPRERLTLARAADNTGLGAVLVCGPPGTETLRAAAVSSRTQWTRIAVLLHFGTEDPVTLAEEVAVLDNLANGRVIVVPEGETVEELALFNAALAGEDVRGVTISPLPPQPTVPVWKDAAIIDLRYFTSAEQQRQRLAGHHRAFVHWTGNLDELQRLTAPVHVVELSRRFL